MTSFRTRPLDLATEADFGALGRLPRQDLAHIKPHLLAATPLFLARCHIRVIGLFHPLQRVHSVLPVDPVVPFEHRIGLMARYGHDNRVVHPRLSEVRHRAMPEIVEPELLNPG